MSLRGMMREPSAFAPVAMSFAALATLAVHVAIYGTAREPDEGTAAHIFQLLIVAQAPIILYFAATRLPRAPRPAIAILVMQVAAVLLALAPVLYLDF